MVGGRSAATNCTTGRYQDRRIAPPLVGTRLHGYMQDTAPKSVDGPHHQDVKPSPHRLLEYRVEC